MSHKYGMGWLGGGRYRRLIQGEHPRAFGASVFPEVDGFGDGYAALEDLAKVGIPFLVAPLLWRDDHAFRSSDVGAVRSRAKKLRRLIATYPKVKWYVVPLIEHRLNEGQWLPFAKVVEEELKGLQFEVVNSPDVRAGFVSRKYLNEYHGGDIRPRRGGRFAFNFDGTQQVDADIEAYKANYRGAEYFLLWNCQCNGNRIMGEKKPRKTRVHWPTPEQADSWIYQTQERGIVSIPRGWIYKSHSDQHTVPPSGKDQKPVWITPVSEKHAFIELRAANGQVIDRARYFGTFNDKATKKVIGHRYYHTDWGYKLAEKAKRIQGGNPVVQVWAGGKRIGVVNPAFRSGSFRG